MISFKSPPFSFQISCLIH